MNDNGVTGDETADDGIYSTKALIPAGIYECKFVLNNAWTQNTTIDNLNFSSDGIQETIFTYNMATNAISIDKVSLFQNSAKSNGKIAGQWNFIRMGGTCRSSFLCHLSKQRFVG